MYILFKNYCRNNRVYLLNQVRKFDNIIRTSSTGFSDRKSVLKEEKSEDKQKFYQKYENHAMVVISLIGAYLLYSHRDKIKSKLEIRNAFAKQIQSECGKYKKGSVTYSAEEISKHDSKSNRIWVSFREGVYDITEFVDKHPGGSSKIMMAAGGSIEPFWQIFANHNQEDIYNLLETMRIGNLAKEDVLSQKDKNDPYSNEPLRHKTLKVNGHKPFCAEPPAPMLAESFLTPKELFYVRNHLPVPEVDIQNYTLEFAIENDIKMSLNYEDLNKYPKHTIISAVMCGGNRRSEMTQVKHVRGLSWGVGAVGNASWTGVKLCDILKSLNIDESDYSHVQFEGLDIDPSGTPYSASIPISKALDPRCDVLLALEMNGESLTQDHGFPVRVIVPGVVGARNVKWLTKITVSKNESSSQWQQGDYKGFSPSIDWDTVDFKTAPAIQEMPVTSAICSPQSGDKVDIKNGKIEVKGYAWSGGGHRIIRVDISADQGKSWHIANLIAKDDAAPEGRHWGWTLWKIDLPVDTKNKEIEIWAKAVDSSYNVQPESFQNIWNLRGLLCNAYHKVKIMSA